MRYRIEHDPEIPSTVGKWTPLSTSDLGSQWGGVDHWIRAQGAAVAKGIWWQKHWDFPDIEVTWSGMTDADKADLTAWLSERAARLAVKEKEEKKEYEDRKAEDGDEHFMIEVDMGMKAYYENQLACRADCGERHPRLRCSKCKIARESLSLFFIILFLIVHRRCVGYCSPECQQEDWQVRVTSQSLPKLSDTTVRTSTTRHIVEQRPPFQRNIYHLPNFQPIRPIHTLCLLYYYPKQSLKYSWFDHRTIVGVEHSYEGHKILILRSLKYKTIFINI